MDDSTRQQFKLHLPGLLKVLAEHLYSNKQVALRELIQNAHDSCLRRSLEDPTPGYQPAITISIDRERRIVRLRDNGSGLTADEITNYLATIGRSYTRELRDQASFLAPDQASQLIGQFGFGFLSAFLLAETVTLITRSHKPDSPPLRWSAVGDEYYELRPEPFAEVGTTIELRIKPSASFVLQTNLLLAAIRKYADFLPIPIYLGSDPQPVNLLRPPWEAKNPQRATADYIARYFDLPNPLCVIPLHEQIIDLGHDSIAIPLHGFLFVPPSSVASIREYGDMTV